MPRYKEVYFQKIKEYEAQLLEDLDKLIQINSVRDIETKHLNAPFGDGIRTTFDQMIDFSKRDAFLYKDFDGYAMHISMGQGKEEVGVLGHLDIVHEGNKHEWDFPPFKLTNDGNYLYGRGVNDDKGPVIAAYYALKIIRDLNFPLKRNIKLILGGAEETTWECMKYYFKFNSQPNLAFSPDGNFPIVNGEKGIVKGNFTSYISENTNEKNKKFFHELLYVESDKQWGFICESIKVEFSSDFPESLEKYLIHANKILIENNNVIAFYKGDKILSRNPHKGENIFFKLCEDLFSLEEYIKIPSISFLKRMYNNFINDVYGKKIGLYTTDEEMGPTTFGLTYVILNREKFELGFDYRYPKSIKKDIIFNELTEFSKENDVSLKIKESKDLLYVNPQSKLIKSLSKAYKNITDEEAYCLTKGGASYARVLGNGVAFGPSFKHDIPNTHKPNENIRIKTLQQAIAIYCESIRILAT